MKFQHIFAPALLLLLLCGCGQTLQQSQTLTLPAEEEEEVELPDRVFVLSNGQVTALTFTPNQDYNGTNPPVTLLSSVSGSVVVDSETNNQVSMALSQDACTLSFGVLSGSDPLQTGQLYAPFSNDVGPGSFLNLEDLTSGRKSWIQNAATTGGLTIVSLTDSAIEVDFNFVGLQSNFRQGTGNATGGFNVSGHVLGDLTEL